MEIQYTLAGLLDVIRRRDLLRFFVLSPSKKAVASPLIKQQCNGWLSANHKVEFMDKSNVQLLAL